MVHFWLYAQGLLLVGIQDDCMYDKCPIHYAIFLALQTHSQLMIFCGSQDILFELPSPLVLRG